MSAEATDAPGLFVSFEGGDSAGKSTQIRMLREHLLSPVGAGGMGLDPRRVLLTREPGGTELGAELRRLVMHGEHVDPRAEALLYAADRAHHVATVVRPALAAGQVVLTDRYLDSSVAYQGAGRELDPEQIRELSLWATRSLLPHRTILLDIDPAAMAARRGAETLDRLERAGDAFHERVRRTFVDMAAAEPQRWRVIDAAAAPREVHGAVLEALADDLAALGSAAAR